MKNKKTIERARQDIKFQQGNFLDVELSDGASMEAKHGSQNQGLLTSYGVEKAPEKKRKMKLDRDY